MFHRGLAKGHGNISTVSVKIPNLGTIDLVIKLGLPFGPMPTDHSKDPCSFQWTVQVWTSQAAQWSSKNARTWLDSTFRVGNRCTRNCCSPKIGEVSGELDNAGFFWWKWPWTWRCSTHKTEEKSHYQNKKSQHISTQKHQKQAHLTTAKITGKSLTGFHHPEACRKIGSKTWLSSRSNTSNKGTWVACTIGLSMFIITPVKMAINIH